MGMLHTVCGETKETYRHPVDEGVMFHFQRWKKKRRSVRTYGLSELSRQALSIPGNDIMVSTSWLELELWLL